VQEDDVHSSGGLKLAHLKFSTTGMQQIYVFTQFLFPLTPCVQLTLISSNARASAQARLPVET